MLQSRRMVYTPIAFVLLASAAVVLASRFLPVVEVIGQLQRQVVSWGPAGAVLYPLLFAACNVLLLPGGILSVGAGFFFGLWWGFFIVLVGNAIGAAVSFAVSRRFGMGWIKRRASSNRILQLLEGAVEREAWKIIF